MCHRSIKKSFIGISHLVVLYYVIGINIFAASKCHFRNCPFSLLILCLSFPPFFFRAQQVTLLRLIRNFTDVTQSVYFMKDIIIEGYAYA
jgi:hypothetical protein